MAKNATDTRLDLTMDAFRTRTLLVSVVRDSNVKGNFLLTKILIWLIPTKTALVISRLVKITMVSNIVMSAFDYFVVSIRYFRHSRTCTRMGFVITIVKYSSRFDSKSL